MRRRMLGIAALLLMANASFTATVTACMMPGGAERHATTSTDDSTGAAHHQHHAVAATPDGASSEAPADAPRHSQPVPSCCKAFAPCTSVVAAGAVVTMLASTAHSDLIAALGEFAPASRLVAPETPPPKA